MMDNQQMMALADRCEAASEADRIGALKLFGAISRAIFETDDPRYLVMGRFVASEAFVSAAIMMIPNWAKLQSLSDTEYDNQVEKTWAAALYAREWKAREPGFGVDWRAWAAAPEFALAAACLRARATPAPNNV